MFHKEGARSLNMCNSCITYQCFNDKTHGRIKAEFSNQEVGLDALEA